MSSSEDSELDIDNLEEVSDLDEPVVESSDSSEEEDEKSTDNEQDDELPEPNFGSALNKILNKRIHVQVCKINHVHLSLCFFCSS